jgi:hypothetical protein
VLVKLIPPRHIGETLTPAVGERTLYRASGDSGSGAVRKYDMVTKQMIGLGEYYVESVKRS